MIFIADLHESRASLQQIKRQFSAGTHQIGHAGVVDPQFGARRVGRFAGKLTCLTG
jgi:hypothetical protein